VSVLPACDTFNWIKNNHGTIFVCVCGGGGDYSKVATPAPLKCWEDIGIRTALIPVAQYHYDYLLFLLSGLLKYHILQFQIWNILSVKSQQISGTEATGWTAGVRFPAGSRDIPVLHKVQTDSGAHPASYPMCTGGLFPQG
jgi:hypothetical protein